MTRIKAGTPNEIFTVKDFRCTDSTILDLNVAYRTFGDRSNPAVLHPTCYGGVIDSTLGLLGTGKILSEGYFVIVCALLSNGESSSPSNTPAPYDGPRFPRVRYEDNVAIQYALCQHLGISKLKAVIGFSMGCQMVYHWSVLHPDFLEFGVGLAGSAKTSWHNYCFLEGPKHALLSSADFHDGEYTERPAKGLKAFGRVYSAWALSAPWYAAEKWKEQGYDSLEAFLHADWDEGFGWDANDLLCLLNTWQLGSIVYPQFQSYESALQSIRAKMLIMPCRTDQYFPAEDSAFEVQHLKHGKLKVIESIGGHMAGGCGTEPEATFISDSIRELFNGNIL